MIPDATPQLRKGVVEHCILGAIATKPVYGWELADRLQRAGMIASIGTLYPVLTRLRERGLIAAFEHASGVGPVRKYYRITKSGMEELVAFRVNWKQFSRAVDEIVNGGVS